MNARRTPQGVLLAHPQDEVALLVRPRHPRALAPSFLPLLGRKPRSTKPPSFLGGFRRRSRSRMLAGVPRIRPPHLRKPDRDRAQLTRWKLGKQAKTNRSHHGK